MNRYERAELIRQAAIDYLIANPGTKAPQIIAALKWHPVTGADRLADMTDRGELSRVAALHRAGRQMVKTYAYTALVTKTRSAAKTVKDVTENLKHPAERRPRVVVPEFRDPNRKPINAGYRAGGQGAIRHSAWSRSGGSLS